VEFFSCGQEANLMSIRLSRIFTGRRKILRFAENFHGWADQLVLPPYRAGAVVDDVTLIPFDLAVAEKELATGQYAIVMSEGGGAHMAGQVPVDYSFIRALPELAHAHGALWHLDEVVTGFRDHPGGFQAMVGVKPDLTSFGKIVSSGMPAGALGGRADIFQALGSEADPEKRVKHSGTWNANPMTCAAGVAGLQIVKTGEPQKAANDMAAYLRKIGNQALKEKGIDCRLYGRSITHVYLGPIETEPEEEALPPTTFVSDIVGMLPAKERLAIHLLQRRVATLSGRLFIVSAAHTREDMDNTVTALVDSLLAMQAEGTLG
jgi:glutamate-1-semialdehyde 2,1-aminomutase